MEFKTFSLSHFLALSVIFVISILIFISAKKIKKNTILKKIIRIIIPIFIIILLFFYYIRILKNNYLDIKFFLPLQLCDISFFMVILLFVFEKNKFIFEFVYFIGISGAIQAILTPSLGFDFPDFMFFFFFIEHGIVISSAIYMICIQEMKPEKLSVIRSFLYFNVLGFMILLTDVILKTNYMFLIEKADSPSLMDIMGPWPVYLICCDIAAFISFTVLYLPFIFCKKINNHKK